MQVVTASLLLLALASSVLLLVIDVSAGFRHGDARRVVSALPLFAIALACLAFQTTWTQEPLDR